MKISFNWLKAYIDTEASAAEIGALLTGSGLEVEDIADYYSIPGGLEGIVIGEVISAIPHPNADKLRICQVNLGETQKQIVCGAPNVAAGQKVLVATVGATVYPSKGEPFTINKAKIRGEVSEGMICAEDELSLGESHDGILVLPNEYEVGKAASTYFPIYADQIFEIGLTANRGDATRAVLHHKRLSQEFGQFFGNGSDGAVSTATRGKGDNDSDRFGRVILSVAQWNHHQRREKWTPKLFIHHGSF